MNTTKLSSVTIPANRQRREFNLQKLEELKASIELSEAKNTQLLHPPVLRRGEDDSLILVAGETRLKAITDIFALGGSFRYSGRIFTAEDGLIPFTDLGELSALEAKEAELDENIRRMDLTWQEHAAAVKELHELRSAQKIEKQVEAHIEAGHDPDTQALRYETQSIADTAQEVLGRADGYYQDTIRKELIVAKHLDNPAVAGAKTVQEAFKILKKEETRAEAAQLAVAMGRTSIEETYEILNMDCLVYMADPANHGKFDVILTDAPYGMGADEFGNAGGKLSGTTHQYDDSYDSWEVLMEGDEGSRVPGWCQLAYQVAKPEAHAYVFCDIGNFPALSRMMAAAGWDVFRTPLIAYKQNSGRVPRPEHGPRRQYETILYAIKGSKKVNHIYPDVIPCTGDENMGHGAQKPVALFQNLLQRSVKPGDRVLDSFAGSGPLLEAAANCQCYSVLLEAVPAYYGMCLKRAERLTGSADLLSGL